MNRSEFERLCKECVNILRYGSPIDTGNLRYNGIRYEFIDNETCRIYVDEEIAPYMPFTNEPWISPKWNGKQNPNEHWFDDTVKEMVDYIKTNYGK